MFLSMASIWSRGTITSRTAVRVMRNTLPRIRPAYERIFPAARDSETSRESSSEEWTEAWRLAGLTPIRRTSPFPAPFISHSTARKTRPNIRSGRAHSRATRPG